MNPARPGVYVGTIRHRRTAPLGHAFTYPLFMVLLDIDRIPELMRASRFTSYNRWNWASFHDADHFGEPSRPLRERLALEAAARGLALPSGPIYLLTHLRYLGYCFNPVSFYYCYDTSAQLRLVLAEVNNTFGGRHNYWLEPDDAVAAGEGVLPDRLSQRLYRAAAAKAFYVSPFMPPDMSYAFELSPPGDQLAVRMSLERASGAETRHAFEASLDLTFRPWTPRAIVQALARFPAMTALVTAGIHWEALKLWWKGLPIVPRPSVTGEFQESAAPASAAAVSKQ